MDFFTITCLGARKGNSGESCKSNYDLNSACKRCGTGARLLPPLHVAGIGKVKEDLFATLDGDIIISEGLHSKLHSANIKIEDCLPVVDRFLKPLPFYHLTSRLTFPRSLDTSEGFEIEDQCPECRRDGFYNKVTLGALSNEVSTFVSPLILRYGFIPERFLAQSDVFCSWECLGSSNLSVVGNKAVRFARPIIIVSEKFRTVLQNIKQKKISFDRVFLSPFPLNA